MKSFTVEEIQRKHSSKDSLYLIVNGAVLDVTSFVNFHPAGEQVILSALQNGGNDVTEDFFAYHRTEIFEKYRARLQVGVLENQTPFATRNLSELSKVPYAESPFWRGLHSPYYNESHDRLRLWLRKFLHENVRDEAERCETTDTPPSQEVLEKLGREGILALWIGPGPHLNLVDKLPANLKPQEVDYFHEMIVHQEFSRMLTMGFEDGVVGGRNISVPTLLHFGTDEMRTKIVPSILRGEKHSALAITEPGSGSDVSGIRTTAVLNPEKTHFIVNGCKKWITEGHECDFYVTAVKTESGSMSVILIEKSPGVSTKLLKTVYSSSAKTALVMFEQVKVPVENLISTDGFKCVMRGFNHERWMIAVKQISRARVMVDECWRWASNRIVFKKPLLAQPVIQEKFSQMISRIESCEALMEMVTYQMTKMPFAEQNEKLGGLIALLKFDASEIGHVVATSSVSIFGGRAMTKEPNSQGRFVERYQRTYRLFGVYGGASEIMSSLGVKQAMRNMDKSEMAKL